MGFGEAIKTCFSKYADFSGRARRSEYWWFQLFVFLIEIPLQIIFWILYAVSFAPALSQIDSDGTIPDTAIDDINPAPMIIGGILMTVVLLALVLPSLSVLVRRLHDTGRSGWWYWIGLVPFVGSIILLVFMFLDSEPGQNKWGPNPKGGSWGGIPMTPPPMPGYPMPQQGYPTTQPPAPQGYPTQPPAPPTYPTQPPAPGTPPQS